jgi:predicted esterase
MICEELMYNSRSEILKREILKRLLCTTKRAVASVFLASGFLVSVSSTARCETLTMQNGMQFEGLIGQVAEVGKNPLDDQKIKRIFVLDDGLRRTYVSERLHVSRAGGEVKNIEIILIPNQPARSGRRIASIGRILRADPFDRYGRRRLTLSGGANASGTLPFVQAITEINPLYLRVEGIRGRNSYVSDMRIKTTSIPRETMSKILMNYVDRKDPDERLRVVRLYIQAERYRDARIELQKIIDEFPGLDELKGQVDVLGQAMARRLIDEIEMRRDSGQYSIVLSMIETFPVDGIANETLFKVRDLQSELNSEKTRRERILEQLKSDVKRIADPLQRTLIENVTMEIKAELNLNNLDRLVDYERLAKDPDLTVEQKLAFALTGWFLGPGNGNDDLAVATSLHSVRQIVKDFLAAPTVFDRNTILEKLNEEEGGAAEYIADLLANLKLEPTLPEPMGVPGLYGLQTKPQGSLPAMDYLVQLPPDYDPYRRYPCIVALHGGTAPLHQVNWWAGTYNDALKMRLGQAARHGYIVVAPEWKQSPRREYRFTEAEHHAVLASLRDVMLKFSIDSDTVFLTGYSHGANAAWDIALAHPDPWAGVVLFSPNGLNYVTKYWPNAKGLPMYLIFGELDSGMLVENALHLDRYLNQPGFDCTLVEYIGRGHERFGDEIQRVFEWMNKPANRREFASREFDMVAMRPLDNFFWWVEVEGLPARNMVSPMQWKEKGRQTKPALIHGEIKGSNRLEVRTTGQHVRIGLSPDIVDFADEIHITVNGRKLRDELKELRADPKVILEDVRTRGDRQHPFWDVIESRGARPPR